VSKIISQNATSTVLGTLCGQLMFWRVVL